MFQAAAGAASAFANMWNAGQQAKTQKQFAKNALTWRVADAKRAGVHPLAALGFQGTSYSPQSLGIGSSLSDAGQAVDASLNRLTDENGRRMQELQLEKAGLENDLLRSQIVSHRINSAGRPPTVRARDDSPPGPEHVGLRDSWLSTVPGITLTDPRNSDAQKVQDRYGDLLENIYGVRNWFRDMQYTTTGIPGPDSWALMMHRLRRGRDNGRDYRHR